MVMPLGPGKFYGNGLPRPRFYTDVKLNDERIDPPLSVMDPFLSWANEAHWSMGGLSFRRHRLQGRIEGSIKKLRAEREKIEKKKKKQKKTQMGKDSIRIKSEETEGFDDDDVGMKVFPDSAPPAPIAAKRKRYMALIDEDDEESDDDDGSDGGDEAVRVGVRRGPVRKLGAEFDRVAQEAGIVKGSENLGLKKGFDAVALRTRSRGSKKEDESDVDAVTEMVKELNGSKIKVRRLMKGGKKIESNSIGGNSGSPLGVGTRVSPRLSKLR